jgi:hypothetical protein
MTSRIVSEISYPTTAGIGGNYSKIETKRASVKAKYPKPE